MAFIQKIILASFAAALLVAAQPLPVGAQAIQPLSEAHTLYGVSQYNALGAPCIDCRSNWYANILNPVRYLQVVAILAYERRTEPSNSGPENGTKGLFVGCLVEKVRPHAALGISFEALPSANDGVARTLSILASPAGMVPIAGQASGRSGNGLGVSVSGGATHVSHATHPTLFRLPTGAQKQAAIDCVKDALAAKGLQATVFSDRGII